MIVGSGGGGEVLGPSWFGRDVVWEEEINLFGQQQQDPSQRRPSMSIDSDVRVVTVQVREGRIADWKGGVRDWVLLPPQSHEGLVNGVPSS